MSKKTKAAKAPKQTPAEIKAAADARIAEQRAAILDAVDAPTELVPVLDANGDLTHKDGALVVKEVPPIKTAKQKAKVAPLTLEQRAQLGDKSAQAEIEAAVKKFDDLTGSAKTIAKLNGKAPKAAKKSGKTARIEMLGHSVTSVLRWMGKSGWSKPEARYACQQLGVVPADGTIQIQVLAGKKGERGDPASLSTENVKKLNELRKATPAS